MEAAEFGAPTWTVSPWAKAHGYRHGLALRGRTGRARRREVRASVLKLKLARPLNRLRNSAAAVAPLVARFENVRVNDSGEDFQ